MIAVKKQVLLKTIIHILVLGIIMSPAFSFFISSDPLPASLFNFSITNFSLILFYIINVIWLVPQFILKRKYLYYTLFVLACMLLFIVTQHYFRDMPEMVDGRHMGKFAGHGRGPDRPLWIFLPSFLKFLMIMGLGTSIELILQFENEQKRFEEMQKQKVIKELNFLKNQLNPHFLFNALNNIYSLAHKKSEDTTPAILLLSDMLRYVLYDSGKNQVTLAQEVAFIENYINLEKLKYNPETAPRINCNFELQSEDYPIEPLLFITLIENAFKHGISYLSPSFVLVSLVEDDKEILLSVVNSVGLQKDGVFTNTNPQGLGIDNLKKRMELLYPNKHSFKQVYENSTFKSFLSIKK
ncbi:sensor histidine kinase [Echinicola pacifica]|uniref:Sensor histidine kinase n=1 Tax=Echinicola pacifica TaxID=346377 RepID=A0A918UQB9_9BACT|nr:sensor histidine kinase [Echinicola pacifica]GGZ27890.1 sensor histidine kinase [Echinicola pacifica]